jgi:hydroxyacylglutathione hydrolase
MIHEHQYWQRNSNYLLLGDKRALLIDTGSGFSDLQGVVTALTELPITVLPTHLHWDHVGGIEQFEHHAMLDVPAVRDLICGSELRTRYVSSLSVRGHHFTVDEWLAPDSELDLGRRPLQIMATPGHSRDGLSVLDRQNRLLVVGDLIYDGCLLAALPGSSLAGYTKSLQALSQVADAVDTLLPGHGEPLQSSVVKPLARAVAATARQQQNVPFRRRAMDDFALLTSRGAARR